MALVGKKLNFKISSKNNYLNNSKYKDTVTPSQTCSKSQTTSSQHRKWIYKVIVLSCAGADNNAKFDKDWMPLCLHLKISLKNHYHNCGKYLTP